MNNTYKPLNLGKCLSITFPEPKEEKEHKLNRKERRSMKKGK